MSRKFKKIVVASAIVASTILSATMVSALETNKMDGSNTLVTLGSNRSGWYNSPSGTYYYDENGELLKGIQEIDGETYYFYDYDGHMAYSRWNSVDTVFDNGMIIKVNQEGHVKGYAKIVANEWIYVGSDVYYFDANLNPYYGVQVIDGEKYFFIGNGQLANYESITQYNGYLYSYNRQGKVTDEVKIVANQWILFNNQWYYFDDNLNSYYDVHEINGTKYYFTGSGCLPNSSGIAQTRDAFVSYDSQGVVTEEVKIVANQWIKFGNNWYYYDNDLNSYDGIHEINGVKYYFQYGRLATASYDYTNVMVINKTIYAVNKDGVVFTEKKIVGGDWIYFCGYWYYYDKDLNPYQGVKEIKGVKYVFFDNGQLITSNESNSVFSMKMKNKLVKYNSEGIVIEDVDIVGNQWVDFNDYKYYFDANLNPYQGLQTIDGEEYYFTYDGLLDSYDEGAVIVKNKLVYIRDGKVIDKVKLR